MEPLQISPQTSSASRFAWIFVLGLLLAVQMAWGQTGNTDDSSPHSDAELVSEVEAVQPGEPFTVALRIEMDRGWHSYWKNPGDSGEPTSIDWTLPQGFAAGHIQWPYPHRIEVGPVVSYGYSEEVLLLTTINPPGSLEPGSTIRLEGRASWLICEEVCLPAEEDVSLTLPVRNAEPSFSQWQEDVARTRSKLPRSPEEWAFQAEASAGSYALQITPPADVEAAFEDAYFYPSEKAVLDHAAPQPVSTEGRTHVMALQQSEYAQEPADSLRGVLVVSGVSSSSNGEETLALRVDVPVTDGQDMAAASSGPGASMTFLWALLFAFVGGVILNLMPCVFPVLSVKILSLVEQADYDRATIRRHGLVFGLGILTSMWVLAGVLLVLRMGGKEIGWGFQLQSPVFVALMVLLFFGIGLSLLGVFDVGSGLMSWGSRLQGTAADGGYSGSFLTGVLTTVVASPCTAPFMGAALGFAITLSVVDALLIFTLLGAGIAAPYVALSMAPQLLERLPEPGGWMETLKQLFAFPMFATALWLIWVYGQQVGTAGVTLLLTGILLLGVSAWIVSHWPVSRISARTRFVTRSLAAVALAGAVAAGILGANYTASATGDVSSSTEDTWQEFSAEKVDRLRSEGQPVFLDFTAAWCLTCQVNERTVLNTSAVQEAFARKNVTLIKADWTNRNPEITKALESYGRNGVPLYVLYSGNGSEPVILPEVLTQDIVLRALDQLPESGTAPVQAQTSEEDINRSS